MTGSHPAEERRPSGSSARERLIEAMSVEAGERGYRRTSVELVCRRAVASREEFAAEFPSKEDCFLAAWDAVNERFVRRCVGAYQAPGRWRDRLRAAAEEFLAFVEEEPSGARVLLVELLEAGPRGRARRDLSVRSFASLFDAGRAELANPKALPYEVALAISGSIFVTLRRQLVERSGSPEELMRELMCMAVMPYLGVEAAMRELGEPAERGVVAEMGSDG
jgi:AcrR family transcriptional regulator